MIQKKSWVTPRDRVHRTLALSPTLYFEGNENISDLNLAEAVESSHLAISAVSNEMARCGRFERDACSQWICSTR